MDDQEIELRRALWREKQRRWREANPEKSRAKAAAWAKANPDKKRARDRRFRERNAERILQRRRERAEERRKAMAPIKAARKEARRLRGLTQAKAWREANLERYREMQRDWRESNTDRRRRDKRARKIDRLQNTKALLRQRQGGRCPICATRLSGELHIDHLMPLKLGGSNTLSNLQLVHAGCNLAKSASHPVDHARSLGRLV